MGNRRSAIRAVKSARQHTTTAATEEGALACRTCSTPHWVRQRPPHLHQPRHWWMLNCPRICRPTLSVERNRQLNGGQQWLPSTRCWLQKPSAISARRQRPWLVSACLACRTTSSIGKNEQKSRKNLDFDFFDF